MSRVYNIIAVIDIDDDNENDFENENAKKMVSNQIKPIIENRKDKNANNIKAISIKSIIEIDDEDDVIDNKVIENNNVVDEVIDNVVDEVIVNKVIENDNVVDDDDKDDVNDVIEIDDDDDEKEKKEEEKKEEKEKMIENENKDIVDDKLIEIPSVNKKEVVVGELVNEYEGKRIPLSYYSESADLLFNESYGIYYTPYRRVTKNKKTLQGYKVLFPHLFQLMKNEVLHFTNNEDSNMSLEDLQERIQKCTVNIMRITNKGNPKMKFTYLLDRPLPIDSYLFLDMLVEIGKNVKFEILYLENGIEFATRPISFKSLSELRDDYLKETRINKKKIFTPNGNVVDKVEDKLDEIVVDDDSDKFFEVENNDFGDDDQDKNEEFQNKKIKLDNTQ